MLCALTIRSTVGEEPPPGGNTEPLPQYPCAPIPTEASPAFEGAMGWAKYAFAQPPQGYNPNYWYEVTNADDYIPGVDDPEDFDDTLRYAIEEISGPRNIKVLVNGTITLKTRLSMDDQSYVKITGEYATRIGPTIIGDEFRIKDCDNIVLRYMRFRSGVLDSENPQYHCGRSLNIWGDQTGCNDIIVDHCSIGASRDDNISVSGKLCRVTVQNCIIGGGNTNLPTNLKRDDAWDDMPSDTILDAEDVEAHVLANAGCRLPLSSPALDSYDQALRAAQLITDDLASNIVFPENVPTNDGNPGTPTLLYPLHQATGVSTSVTLTWTASDETDDYEVFLDTNTFPTTSIGVTSNTQIQASNLQANTLYRWRVVARDSCENTSGTLAREFTTE